jgi:hypothetical protein
MSATSDLDRRIVYITRTQPTLRDYLAHGFDAQLREPLLDLS